MTFAQIGLALGAALTFGVGDILSGLTARRLGTMRSVAWSRLAGAVGFLLLLLVTRSQLPANPIWVLKVVLLGMLGAAGFLALVQAFRVGPLSVVSTIVASTGAMSVVVAVVVLGDRLSALQWVAVPVATLGSMLAAVVFDEGLRRPRLVGRGPLFAAMAVVCLGSVTVIQQAPIHEAGWIPAVFIRRLTEAVVIWAVFVAFFARSSDGEVPMWTGGTHARQPEGPGARVLAVTVQPAVWMSGIGLLDAVSLSFLALGLSIAPAWLLGLVTSVLSPVIAIAVGIALFGERLRPSQWTGIGLVICGLVLVVVR